ncbi:MAG: hypothetical protein ACYTKD_13345 [Planctomycetota bacterium]|jgi:hypothetical protein
MENPSADPAAAEAAPQPRAGPRFPWAPAALCAASLVMAAWTWMRYSYGWDVTNIPSDRWGEGLYVECSGEGLVPNESSLADFIAGAADGKRPSAFVRCNPGGGLLVGRVGGPAIPDYDGHFFLSVRMVPFLDTTTSRLRPASAAGLVVASFVTFVFALYLRSWLRERSAAASA